MTSLTSTQSVTILNVTVISMLSNFNNPVVVKNLILTGLRT